MCNVLTDIEIAQQLQKDAEESEPDEDVLPVRHWGQKSGAHSRCVHASGGFGWVEEGGGGGVTQ